MESWEFEQKMNQHSVFQQIQSRIGNLTYMADMYQADRNSLMEIRNELGMLYSYSNPNGPIYMRLDTLERRLDVIESSLSTIEKAFLHLQSQLGYVETLRVPSSSIIEERLDEDGID